MTYQGAARRLRVSEATIRGRLVKARSLLRLAARPERGHRHPSAARAAGATSPPALVAAADPLRNGVRPGRGGPLGPLGGRRRTHGRSPDDDVRDPLDHRRLEPGNALPRRAGGGALTAKGDDGPRPGGRHYRAPIRSEAAEGTRRRTLVRPASSPSTRRSSACCCRGMEATRRPCGNPDGGSRHPRRPPPATAPSLEPMGPLVPPASGSSTRLARPHRQFRHQHQLSARCQPARRRAELAGRHGRRRSPKPSIRMPCAIRIDDLHSAYVEVQGTQELAALRRIADLRFQG